jgi:hypothetical protein
MAHQRRAWNYLANGGKRAIMIWHRRSGKDAIGLNYTVLAACNKPATYWYMLPMQRQARRVIWEAVDPFSGMKRLDEALPNGIRKKVHEQEMSIELTNGSMIHLLGSDNYNSLVGSPPYGVVFSEWALAKQASWGFIRPILRQNGGWAMFITTPRGRNHAYTMYQAALKHPESWYAETLSALQTNVFTQEEIDEEYDGYIDEFGIEDGHALFEQEYLCSFESAIRGSYWGAELIRAEREGRIISGLKPLPGLPVHTAWDIGVDNATAIWFFQVTPSEVRWLHYYEQNGMTVEHFARYKQRIGKEYGFSYVDSIDYVPHDARQRSWTSSNVDGTARQRLEDMKENGLNPQLVPNHARVDGIYAARKTIGRSLFHAEHCAEGIDCLKNYQRTWDADKRIYANTPFHNWAENGASAFRYGSIAWRGVTKPKPPEKGRVVVRADAVGRMRTGLTFDELRNRGAKNKKGMIRERPTEVSSSENSFIAAREAAARRRKKTLTAA